MKLSKETHWEKTLYILLTTDFPRPGTTPGTTCLIYASCPGSQQMHAWPVFDQKPILTQSPSLSMSRVCKLFPKRGSYGLCYKDSTSDTAMKP